METTQYRLQELNAELMKYFRSFILYFNINITVVRNNIKLIIFIEKTTL